MSMKIPLTPTEVEPATFRFVAQHLNHCATAVVSSSVLLTKFYSDDQIKKNEMDGERGMNGGENRCIQDFGRENRRKEIKWKT